MKKITYLILTLLMCGFLQIYSQTHEEPTEKISLGIIGGINFADRYFRNSQDADDQRLRSSFALSSNASKSSWSSRRAVRTASLTRSDIDRRAWTALIRKAR